MGVAVPEMLSREPAQAAPTEEDDDRLMPQGGIFQDLNSTNKTNSLVEFMEIES